MRSRPMTLLIVLALALAIGCRAPAAGGDEVRDKSAGEPGTPLSLEIDIVDANDGGPLEGADGKVSVRTIRPAHYHPHYDATEPAHVHFTITLDGYRPWGGEIFFDDDERVDAAVRAEASRVGTPIVRTVAGPDGVQRAVATLRMQPLY